MSSVDEQTGEDRCNEEENDENDDEIDVRDEGVKYGVTPEWVDNTKENHVTVTMNTRFIVFIGAVTEQLAAMGLRCCVPFFEQRSLNRRRPRDSYRIRESESEPRTPFEQGWEGVPSI